MTDAGFFRGTSADQDNRFANKQKKLLKELNFSPILNTKLNMSKIELEKLKPWVEQKIKEILDKDDDILSNSIYEYLEEKEPDGKGLLVLIMGFFDAEDKASKFVEELWSKLIDSQDTSNGVSPKMASSSSPGNGLPQTETPKGDNDDDHQPPDDTREEQSAVAGDASADRSTLSRSRSPQSKANSPARSRTHSRSPSKKSDSKSRSKSPSKSSSKSRSGSRSRSASKSLSNSKSSHSRSRSRSSSRSLRRSRSRSRSPEYRGQRVRRSRSRSGSCRRRSRSPRGRRGYGGRSTYRGFAYDRRRGPVGPPRRRPSPPWSRRRFSPRVSPPMRRRRTPSPMSPRRRSRSPVYRRSPDYRRRSRSRTPPYGHMLGRRSPRPHTYGTQNYAPRHLPPPHREIQRPLLTSRSPRVGPLEHRGYGDGPMLPRHSPANVMIGRQHDLPPLISHKPPAPSRPYSPPSPASGSKKKHKKDKKHRKHKKSKKHRSATPEKRKKHKKHKKTKKHKS